MKNKFYVEDCSTITPKNLFKRLKRLNTARTGDKQPDIECWLDKKEERSSLLIRARGGEPQKLFFEWVDVNFGQVAYFQCDCGRRVAKLYQPPGSFQYKCRTCHKLKYRLSGLNSKSVAGQALYKFNRINKLMETRENIKRVFYKGKYTRRFNRFLKLCKDAGIDSVVEDSHFLLDVVENSNIF